MPKRQIPVSEEKRVLPPNCKASQSQLTRGHSAAVIKDVNCNLVISNYDQIHFMQVAPASMELSTNRPEQQPCSYNLNLWSLG
jgi:hypothetical protein